MAALSDWGHSRIQEHCRPGNSSPADKPEQQHTDQVIDSSWQLQNVCDLQPTSKVTDTLFLLIITVILKTSWTLNQCFRSKVVTGISNNPRYSIDAQCNPNYAISSSGWEAAGTSRGKHQPPLWGCSEVHPLFNRCKSKQDAVAQIRATVWGQGTLSSIIYMKDKLSLSFSRNSYHLEKK